ncbi:MAG TPA: ferritin-like domain-containing protein [Acidimicrobiales bacterium]|nr:ferritin-like domain-containing protein [Acidimicrobiales bacterium]
MRNSHKDATQMQISEAELTSLTSDLNDAHYETLSNMHATRTSWNPSQTPEQIREGFSRRNFLTRSSLFAAGGLLVATTGAGASTLPRLMRTDSPALVGRKATSAPLDVRVAALAASLENLAVSTYGSALSAATTGKLGAVPSALANFVKTAMAQHKDHAAAWNAIISSAGYDKITAPNAVIGASVAKAFSKVTDVPGVALLALSLEEAASATYLEAIDVLGVHQAIETAATIQPVEMQHVAILNFVLGRYPVPQAFASTLGAATLAQGPSVKRR